MQENTEIQGLEACPECGDLLECIWENNGFTAPDPEHWEVVGVVCPSCGYEED